MKQKTLDITCTECDRSVAVFKTEHAPPPLPQAIIIKQKSLKMISKIILSTL
jgi:hypothetical protein